MRGCKNGNSHVYAKRKNMQPDLPSQEEIATIQDQYTKDTVFCPEYFEEEVVE